MLTKAQIEKRLSPEDRKTLDEHPEVWPDFIAIARRQRTAEIQEEQRARAARAQTSAEKFRVQQAEAEARRAARKAARLPKLREIEAGDLEALGTLKLLELKGPEFVARNLSRATFYRHKKRLAEINLTLAMKWPASLTDDTAGLILETNFTCNWHVKFSAAAEPDAPRASAHSGFGAPENVRCLNDDKVKP